MNKQLKEDIKAVGRGIKKVYVIAVGVGEVIAWAILLGIAYFVLYRAYSGVMELIDAQLYAVWFAALAVSLRMATEFVKYLKLVGQVESGVKK